jgi:protocatechuate 3,4-dioxygenase beta subunit
MKQQEHHDQDPFHDLGLTKDLEQLERSPVDRRNAMRLGLLGLSGFVGSNPLAQAINACVGTIPRETAGPFPGNGSNGANALQLSGIVRSDIRSSLKTENMAVGVPIEYTLTLVASNKNCQPLVGYAIYLWHCDAAGLYSMYSQGVTAEDYLRGVQSTDKNGQVKFISVFPACYAGRFPHVHFEVYPSLSQATTSRNVLHTSQFAIPEDACSNVYNNVSAYAGSKRTYAQVSLQTDNVFRDGSSLQMPSISGSIKDGFKTAITVGISV